MGIRAKIISDEGWWKRDNKKENRATWRQRKGRDTDRHFAWCRCKGKSNAYFERRLLLCFVFQFSIVFDRHSLLIIMLVEEAGSGEVNVQFGPTLYTNRFPCLSSNQFRTLRVYFPIPQITISHVKFKNSVFLFI